jgi:hypothetical protein
MDQARLARFDPAIIELVKALARKIEADDYERAQQRNRQQDARPDLRTL